MHEDTEVSNATPRPQTALSSTHPVVTVTLSLYIDHCITLRMELEELLDTCEDSAVTISKECARNVLLSHVLIQHEPSLEAAELVLVSGLTLISRQQVFVYWRKGRGG